MGVMRERKQIRNGAPFCLLGKGNIQSSLLGARFIAMRMSLRLTKLRSRFMLTAIAADLNLGALILEILKQNNEQRLWAPFRAQMDALCEQ